MGSKRIHIDLDDVRRLAALHCTEAEAASFFKIGVKKFKQILEQMPEVYDAWIEGQGSGKISLRRKQFRLASENASMAIHLGKNLLGQKDVVATELSGPGGGPIEGIDLTQLSSDERNKLRDIVLKSRKSGSTT